MDDALLRLMLQALHSRGPVAGYDSLQIPGYSAEQIDAAVDELRRGGYINGAFIPKTLGTTVGRWDPSTLTEKGRDFLKRLQG